MENDNVYGFQSWADEEEFYHQEENTIEFDKRHGGPWDRGSADSYYRRSRCPHYFVGGTYHSEEITEDQMTEAEIAAYHAGFDDNEKYGDFKDWG